MGNIITVTVSADMAPNGMDEAAASAAAWHVAMSDPDYWRISELNTATVFDQDGRPAGRIVALDGATVIFRIEFNTEEA